jgi:O-antigen/teichoic acid export membrane protein
MSELNSLLFGSLLRKNVLANYIGSTFVIVSPIIAIPFYLSFLGPYQFGLVGFVMLIQSSLNLLDAGLAQALVREITISLSYPNGRDRVSNLIFNVERLYWFFALLIAVFLVATSTFISTHWLHLEKPQYQLGVEAVCGAAIIFFFQFPGALYKSFLIASQAHVQLNKTLVLANIIRHVGGVFVVFLYPSIATYLIWQALVGLLETVLRRKKVLTELGNSEFKERWNLSVFFNFFKLVRGLSIAVWIGALPVQMDKVILSRMVSIDKFGYYSIASSIALGVLQLIYPLLQAVQPKAISLRNEPLLILQLYKKLFAVIFLLFLALIVGFITSGQFLLRLWLPEGDGATFVYAYGCLLMIGTAFNALYNVGYMDWVVKGKTKFIFTLNSISLALILVIVPLAIKRYGAAGAPLGWIVCNVIAFLCSLGWLRQKGKL